MLQRGQLLFKSLLNGAQNKSDLKGAPNGRLKQVMGEHLKLQTKMKGHPLHCFPLPAAMSSLSFEGVFDKWDQEWKHDGN